MRVSWGELGLFLAIEKIEQRIQTESFIGWNSKRFVEQGGKLRRKTESYIGWNSKRFVEQGGKLRRKTESYIGWNSRCFTRAVREGQDGNLSLHANSKLFEGRMGI